MSTNAQSVNTLADLMALAAPSGGVETVTTLGYNAIGDGGGNTYYYNASSNAAGLRGLIIVPSSSPPTGRWFAVDDGLPLNLRRFGAVGDGMADDTPAVAAWSAGMQPNVWSSNLHAGYVPQGGYLTSPFAIGTNTTGSESLSPYKISGDGFHSQFIAKIGSSGTFCEMTNIAGVIFKDILFDLKNISGLVGIDTSWNIGAGPSLGNLYENIYINNASCPKAWIAENNNDAAFRDCTIENSSGYSLYLEASGGNLSIDNMRSTGVIFIDTQNAWIGKGGYFVGVEIGGGSYNTITFDGVQIYASTAIVDASGNALCVKNSNSAGIRLSFKGSQFNGLSTAGAVFGNSTTSAWRTATLDGCSQISGSGSFPLLSPNINGAYGSGQPVVFTVVNSNLSNAASVSPVFLNLQNCSFGGTQTNAETVTPTYLNSWSSAGMPTGFAGLSASRNGTQVTLHGSLTGGTNADGTAVFSLPASWRPVPFNIAGVSAGFDVSGVAKPFSYLISYAGAGGTLTIDGAAANSLVRLSFDGITFGSGTN